MGVLGWPGGAAGSASTTNGAQAAPRNDGPPLRKKHGTETYGGNDPPFLPSFASWVEAMSHPAVMDTTRAKTELGWTPRYTGLEALRDTIRH